MSDNFQNFLRANYEIIQHFNRPRSSYSSQFLTYSSFRTRHINSEVKNVFWFTQKSTIPVTQGYPPGFGVLFRCYKARWNFNKKKFGNSHLRHVFTYNPSPDQLLYFTSSELLRNYSFIEYLLQVLQRQSGRMSGYILHITFIGKGRGCNTEKTNFDISTPS